MAGGAPRFVMPFQTALDAAGATIPGALLFFYITGSSTPANTYSDADLTTPNSNPVEADGAGVFPNIFLNPAVTYKVTLTGPDDGVNPPEEYWTADPVTALSVYYPVAFEFLGGDAPSSNEVLGMHTFLSTVTFPVDYEGSAGYIVNDFSGAFVAAAEKEDGTPVGTMTITAGGAFSFTTEQNDPITFLAGETMIWRAPNIAVAGGANIAWTLMGVAA